MARKGTTNRRGSPPNPPAKAPETLGVGRRELIMVSEADAQLRVSPSGMRLMGTVVTGLSRLLASPDIRIQPLFGHTEERVRSLVAEIPDAEGLANLETYYHVDAPSERLDELAESLMKLDEVAAAYVKPAGEPPEINDRAPAADEAPSTTPDFSARKIYLNAAPAGIDARYAWRFRGGRGAGTKEVYWTARFQRQVAQSSLTYPERSRSTCAPRMSRSMYWVKVRNHRKVDRFPRGGCCQHPNRR